LLLGFQCARRETVLLAVGILSLLREADSMMVGLEEADEEEGKEIYKLLIHFISFFIDPVIFCFG